MQVTLDRRNCKRLPCVCEACFSEHLRSSDFENADCSLSVRTNHRPELTFKVYDRDASIKTLVVTKENMKQALNSWIAVWEYQSGPVI